MGIRFRCANGHKLNVKDFLAGKRAICPDCGIKLKVPIESDPALLREREVRRHSKGKGGPVTSPSHGSPDLPRTPDLPEIKVAPVELAVSAPGRTGPEPGANRSGAKTPAADAPSGPGASAVATIATGGSKESTAMQGDVNASAAGGLWYVRPPAGGQFGPASNDVFHSWVAEGRVTSESFLWREGWADWQPAAEVLGVETAKDVAPQPVIVTTPDSTAALPDAKNESPPQIVASSSESSATELYRRRKSTKMALMMVVLLGLACAVLAAALVFVVRYR